MVAVGTMIEVEADTTAIVLVAEVVGVLEEDLVVEALAVVGIAIVAALPKVEEGTMIKGVMVAETCEEKKCTNLANMLLSSRRAAIIICHNVPFWP